MSKEGETHISMSEAAYATISGALLGAGIFVPALGGLGLTAATIGILRVRSRERDRQFEQLSSYLGKSLNTQEIRESMIKREKR
jgi:hypothetical protein